MALNQRMRLLEIRRVGFYDGPSRVHARKRGEQTVRHFHRSLILGRLAVEHGAEMSRSRNRSFDRHTRCVVVVASACDSHREWRLPCVGRDEALRGENLVLRNAGLVRPTRQVIVMQGDDVLTENLPFLIPGVAPDRRLARCCRLIRRSGKRTRRIDLLPRGPVFARDPVDVFKGEPARTTVTRKVGCTRFRLARIGARAREPVAKLLQHPGVVVEDLEYVILDEEWIHIRVSIEADTGEKIRVRVGKGRDDPSRSLQIAPLIVTNFTRVYVIGERARQLRRVGRTRQILQIVVWKDDVVLCPLAIIDILFQMIVDVPLGGVAACIGPNSTIEDKLHR